MDLLGLIAVARAQLMMRGHSAVRVQIGPATLARLRRDAAPYAPYEGQILDMPYEVSDEFEGFAVVPA